MQIFNLNKASGREISKFNSNFVMNRILHTKSAVQIGCMFLEENGVIGYHQAAIPQLLLITAGEGKVRGKNDSFVNVRQGDAVYWEEGEWHETKTEKGLVAIVIEGKDLKSALILNESGAFA